MSFFSTLFLCCDTAAVAQDLPPGAQQRGTITSSPNPVGSGARAVGMGGAFIAVADDATAASWNPAGLSQLRKPEFSVVYSYFKRHDDFHIPDHPESSGSSTVSSDDLNYFSVAYPFKLLQRNMIISLNYQLLYDFDRNFSFSLTDKKFYNNGMLARTDQKLNFKQSGKLRALSPAYAIQVTPQFSLGITFNFWTDKLSWDNGWESYTLGHTSMFYGGSLIAEETVKDHERYSGFSGFNMNIGFLWHVNSRVTIGGVLKTPFTAHVRHTRKSETITLSQDPKHVQQYIKTIEEPYQVNEKVDVKMPLSFGFGVALRCTDAFTVSLDVYHTQWNKFVLENSLGERMSPITGESTQKSHVGTTTQVRLGAEYLFILTNTIIPVRGGLFYDPEPADNHPQDFWGFSLGTGVSIKNVIFDVAYQYRQGNNVRKQAFTGTPGIKADVTQHLILASLIYHFE